MEGAEAAAAPMPLTRQPGAGEHFTSEFLYPEAALSTPTFLVVLNYTLPKALPWLWHRARHRVCADGGANRLFDELPAMLPTEDPNALRKRFVPNAIRGDLDSLRPDVAAFYAGLGVHMEDLSADQDTTDLTKAVAGVAQLVGEDASKEGAPPPHVLVLGALGGRLDHTLSNLNTLYMFPTLRVTLWGDGNLVRLLPPGRNVIVPDVRFEGPACGLIPLGPPVTGNSTGLRWNLCDTRMAIGALISTSNVLEGEEVAVSADGSLLWTTELREDALLQALRAREPPAAS